MPDPNEGYADVEVSGEPERRKIVKELYPPGITPAPNTQTDGDR